MAKYYPILNNYNRGGYVRINYKYMLPIYCIEIPIVFNKT